MRNPWMRIATDAWLLGFEAAAVIGQRTLKIAAGGAGARAESVRMVSEKAEALAALRIKALTGGLGTTPAAAATQVLAHYRRKVRQNRRRLT